MVTEAEKKVLLDAVHELVRELFDTAHAHGAAESEKSAKISAIDEEYKPKLAAYARRESDIKRQLGELLGPNYDGLTEPARTALITLADGYYVKRTRPESLELIGELDRIIESIELALVSHSSDHTIDEFVTYPDPVILKDVIKKKENRYLIEEVEGLQLVYTTNFIYGHNQDKTITDKDVDRYIQAGSHTSKKEKD